VVTILPCVHTATRTLLRVAGGACPACDYVLYAVADMYLKDTKLSDLSQN
jgi:hypothetical protein